MKFSFTKKECLLWCVSVVSGAVSLSGAALLAATDDPAALVRLIGTYHLIHGEYFRPVSDTELLDGASAGMVHALGDPYSTLITGDSYDDFMTQTSGEYGGIGVVIGMDQENALRVLAVFPDSPAKQAGIQPGDVVTAIDGKPAGDGTIDDAAEHIRGKAGTEVHVTVMRNGGEMRFSVTRSNITMPTVEGHMAEGDIGYIHIYSFASHTADEFRKTYETLAAQGMKKMIIDLRMNPGGMIDSVTAVADQILTAGTVVSYQVKSGETENFQIKGIEKPLPMVVLIDKDSASASEILAGAVQDKKEGIIMGERSFGKGTVQVVHPVAEREVLKISVAQYLTASGRKIDKVGIEPDKAVPQRGRVFDPASDNVYQSAVRELQAMGE